MKNWMKIIIACGLFAHGSAFANFCDGEPRIANPGLTSEKIDKECREAVQTEVDQEVGQQAQAISRGERLSACQATLEGIQERWEVYKNNRIQLCDLIRQRTAATGGLANCQRDCFRHLRETDSQVKAKVDEVISYLRTSRQDIARMRELNVDSAQVINDGSQQEQQRTGGVQPPSQDAARRFGNRNIQAPPNQVANAQALIEQMRQSGITGDVRGGDAPPAVRDQLAAASRAAEFERGLEKEIATLQNTSTSLGNRATEVGRSENNMNTQTPNSSAMPGLNQALQAGNLATQAAGLAQQPGSSPGAGALGVAGVTGERSLKDLAGATAVANDPAAAADPRVAAVNGTRTGSSGANIANTGSASTVGTSARERLRSSLGKRNGSGASRMPAGNPDAPVLDKSGNPVIEKDGTTLTQGELAKALASGQDPLAQFGVDPLGDGAGLGIAGSETDAQIKGFVEEMSASMGLGKENVPQIQTAREILAADSGALFDRIRDLHTRCLKRGCVLGKVREKL